MRHAVLVAALVLMSPLARADSTADPAPQAASATALPMEDADQLRKIGSEAALSGDCVTAVRALTQLKKLKPRERVSRTLLRDCVAQLKEEEADAYAKVRGPRQGLKVSVVSLPNINNIASTLGGGLIVGWINPDPEKLALGYRLGGWYSDYHYFYDASSYHYANWGNSFGGAAQLQWLPWHGRGVRNKVYADLALGPGFVQKYHNEIWPDPWGNTPNPHSDSILEYSPVAALSIGTGYSTKYGFDIEVGGNSYLNGGGLWNVFYQLPGVQQLYLNLGYLF